MDNHINQQLFHSVQGDWSNVKDILIESQADKNVIEFLDEYIVDYKNKNLFNTFVIKMKDILSNEVFKASVINHTNEAIQNNIRVPYDFLTLIE